MAIKTAWAEWANDFKTGRGVIKSGNGAFEADYSYGSIFSNAPGTSPTEILGASLAGCFSGALAAYLCRINHIPKRICTVAEVHLAPPEAGFAVEKIHLITQAEVPGIDEDTFLKQAEMVKRTCPVAKALGATKITLQAELV